MRILKRLKAIIIVGLMLLAIKGCAVVPKELDSMGQDNGQNFSRKVVMSPSVVMIDALIDQYQVRNGDSPSVLQARFARGDTLSVKIVGMEQYNGLYKISSQGTLELPFAPAFPASGRSRRVLIDEVEDELVRLKWFYRDSVKVNLSLVELAAINVSVTGAVFNPGRVLVNAKPAVKAEETIQHEAGAFAPGRDLVAAVAAAGGIRPDANLSQVYLKRQGTLWSVPLVKLINGDGFTQTPMLINGDQIIVGSTGEIDRSLIKPSQVTSPGMRIFMSNLTAPALSNAQSAVGADATRLPYGASLLDSALSANCIGGTHHANASRSVVLVTRNFGASEQIVIRRSINQLLANSSNKSVNPFLMPNDGVACYDSRFTNFRDVARGIGEVISPLLLGRLL